VLDHDRLLAQALPSVEIGRVQVVETGWDSVVLDVDDTWIVRAARTRATAAAYALEAALLPELARALPLAIPVPFRTGDEPVAFIAYRKLPGAPFSPERAAPDGDALGAQLGAFLARLHGFPAERARRLGAPDAAREPTVAAFRERVVPLLNATELLAADALLATFLALEHRPALVHADLGPEHVLVDAGRITGVIDWSDARVGDPAIDLAWALHGATAPFAASVRAAYGADDALAARALVYHRLGPWHEVIYGLDTRQDGWVASGLAGVRRRLAIAGGADTMAG
jgi:aminoglycoside phosphotransferase (APT) family kinase protein